MSSLAWYWFQFELPPAWEVTAYTTGEEKGSLQCYTRDGFQGELNWRRVKAVPDQRRIMAEIHRRYLQAEKSEGEEPVPDLSFRMVNGFHVGIHRRGEPFQASLFQEETRMLLEWVFPDYTPELLDSAVRPLLQSYRPIDGPSRRWAVFGIDVVLPLEYRLEEVQPLPGHSVLEWVTRKRMHFTARRWALPEELLGPMGLPEFGRHLMRKLYRKTETVAPETVRGHEGTRVHFTLKGRVGLERIVGQWWPGEVLLWWDREAKRITALEQYGPKRQPRLELSDVWHG